MEIVIVICLVLIQNDKHKHPLGFGLGPKLVEKTSPLASSSGKLRSELEPKMVIVIAI